MAYIEYFQSKEFLALLHQFEESGQDQYADFSSNDLTDLAEYYHTVGNLEMALRIVDSAIDLYPGAVGPLVFRARTSLVKENNPGNTRNHLLRQIAQHFIEKMKN